MFKKVLIGAVAVAMTSGVANAGENKFTKEEGTGLATGAAVANLQSTALMFVLVILVAGSFWMLGRLLDPFRRRGEETRRFRDASSFPTLEPQRKENSHGD